MAGRDRRFLDLRQTDGDPTAGLVRLCQSCVSDLGVDAAAVGGLRDDRHLGLVAASGAEAAGQVALQRHVGDGPALSAHRAREPVVEASLATSERWPGYTPEALSLGVAACASFPLQIGTARFGTLDLFSRSPGGLSPERRRAALDAADAAAELLVGLDAGLTPDEADPPWLVLGDRPQIHQAAGMASVQLDASIEEAYVALRVRAHSDRISLDQLATGVLALEVSLALGAGKTA